MGNAFQLRKQRVIDIDTITEKQRHLVYDYASLYMKKAYVCDDVINLIFLFYWAFRGSPGEFDAKRRSKTLVNIGGGHGGTYTKVLNYDLEAKKAVTFYPSVHATILLTNAITHSMCSRFVINIQYSYTDYAMPIALPLSLGYGTSYNCIKNWSHGLGKGDNRQETLGFWMNSYEKVYLHDKHNHGRELENCMEGGVQKGDVFTMIFNFKRDCLQILRKRNNRNKCKNTNTCMNTVSLNGHKCVYIGVCVSDHLDIMEILNWSFYK